MGKQKQYRHSVKLLPLAFLLLVSNVLANDQSIQPKRNGIYLGTGLGVSYLSPSTRQVSSTAVDDKRALPSCIRQTLVVHALTQVIV